MRPRSLRTPFRGGPDAPAAAVRGRRDLVDLGEAALDRVQRVVEGATAIDDAGLRGRPSTELRTARPLRPVLRRLLRAHPLYLAADRHLAVQRVPRKGDGRVARR